MARSDICQDAFAYEPLAALPLGRNLVIGEASLPDPHDHALCLAGFMAFVRGVDIDATIEAARVALVERALTADAQIRTLTAERDDARACHAIMVAAHKQEVAKLEALAPALRTLREAVDDLGPEPQQGIPPYWKLWAVLNAACALLAQPPAAPDA